MTFPLLHDPARQRNANVWYCHIPLLGWQVGYHRQLKNERQLVRQAADRGPVPESAWGGLAFDREVRDKLTQICRDNAYNPDTTFHPDDPFELMMVLRYGDLNEVEIMMDIEDAYGISFHEELMKELIGGMTFCEFIRYVEKHRSR